MSTEKLTAMIRDHADKNSLYPLSPRDRSSANARAEGLASEIEREFIVIPRADLPEVKEIDQGYPIAIVPGWAPIAPINQNADECRKRALAHLALAEYLDAHPPIPEQDVEVLADVIEHAAGSIAIADPRGFARALLASQKVEVKR